MHFLEHYWFLFLLSAVVFWILVAVNQVRRMGRMVEDAMMLDGEDFFSGFFKGVIPLFVYGILGGVSFILFVIGAVAALIRAFK